MWFDLAQLEFPRIELFLRLKQHLYRNPTNRELADSDKDLARPVPFHRPEVGWVASIAAFLRACSAASFAITPFREWSVMLS